jgi:adenylate kinase
MRFVFLGPPGVGKGTQAENLSIKEDIFHISSGNLLRETVKAKTEIGLKAKEYIEKGLLVPDELVVKIVVGEISSARCEKGFILDGFPRNLTQAKILGETLNELGKKIDRVFYFIADEGVIVKRIAGRQVCKSCGAHYHEIYMPAKEYKICDKCGSELHQREDDKPETVSMRLKVYREQTESLIDYYRNNKELTVINCNGSISEIWEKILIKLYALKGNEMGTE